MQSVPRELPALMRATKLQKKAADVGFDWDDVSGALDKLEEEIRELMDKERESERTKNELITNVAHDLRTPLTSIIGYLELLSKGIPLPQEMQQKYIEIVYTKAKRLEKLIEDLFGFTKLNYGKISMNVGRVDILQLLTQLLDEFYPIFAEYDMHYEIYSNVRAIPMNGDGNLLARLFENLISNAVKYGKEGKIIKTVSVRVLCGPMYASYSGHLCVLL